MPKFTPEHHNTQYSREAQPFRNAQHFCRKQDIPVMI